jgi:hypothetical protein
VALTVQKVACLPGRSRLWLLFALALLALLGRGGTAAQAQGVGISYRAGWNIVAGPDGTLLPGSLRLLTLGSGDPDYVTLPPQGPIAGGRGYWAYFAADTSVALSGAGAATAQVPAPAGQFVMIGNPSGVQSASVAGADEVDVWDPVAAAYMQTTTLGVGQGGWAMSRTGGTITISGVGPALSAAAAVPIAAATAAPAPQPAATAAPKLGVTIAIDTKNSSASSSAPGTVVFEVDVTQGGQPVTGATLTGTLTFTGLPQGALSPVSFGPDDLSGYSGETITLKVPPLATNARILIHASVALGGQTAATDAVYTVKK